MVGTTFKAIAAGGNHTVALQTDGSLWAWGDNTYGQIGNNTNINQAMPVKIGTGYIAIAAGANHTLALQTDGSLWAWGLNDQGQLGDGTTNNSLIPKRIGTDVYSLIGAGYYASYAAKADGTLLAWGSNFYGQIGDGFSGSVNNRLSPTTIAGFTVAVPDTIAPSVPGGLIATASGASQVNLTWTAATDNVGITAYQVYRDGGTTPLTTLGNVTSYSDTGLTAGTTYSYTVAACDAAGNCSLQSAPTTATTSAATPTLSSIAVSCPTTIVSGQTGACTANASYSDGTSAAVTPTWSVALGSAATIDATGTITASAVTADTAVVVNATYIEGGVTKTATATVTITAATAALSGLTVSCPATVASGQTGSCTANASYSSGPSKTVTPTWSTVLGAAATISATGTITASTVTVDTAVVINASYVENGVTKSATATVTITAASTTPPPSSTNACTGTAKNTAAIAIDGGIFKQAGEPLNVRYCLKNFSKSSRFDIYVAVQLPDGELLYMQSAGFFNTPIFTSTLAPYLSNTLVPDLNGPVLSVEDLPMELPTGTYTFYAIPVLAGKSVLNGFNWVGQLSQGSFTLGH